MTGDEGTGLADVVKAARHLEGLFGGGAAKEALRRATNAGASGSPAAEMQWQRVAKYLSTEGVRK